ncbi:L-threonylcarbamoyladenylate synthase [Flavobacterium sp.]|uniref:L-threonylcarbamoyladenylate synthase n=1 Tax=Flavobacterium sp. TaxID=239 RepID=UPI002487FC44|nr:L-threonylcarbamoyladenylate synthase [Flavobacterium sp.]MDI1316213.1 L-threonylcarbamoyladenylate synthase [Flavobacterium sp.]
MISNNIDLAARILKDEGIIGFPTETVYGLAGNIFSDKAIKEIYTIKQRPFYNPLIVHIKSMEDLKTIAVDIPPMALKLAKSFWPGPLTLLLKKNASVPDLITAGKPTVAVRIPNHPTALALLNLLDFPLAAPSANPFGMISPTKAEHVAEYFQDNIEMVLDGGACQTGIESTIIGFNQNEVVVYRLGGISIEEIKTIAGDVTLFTKNDTAPEAPGMLSKHYAPATPLIFTENIEKFIPQFKNKRVGLLLFSTAIVNVPNDCIQMIVSPNENLKEAAARLYDTLHQLDKMNLEVIIAEKFPDTELGRVINDKLTRASLNK